MSRITTISDNGIKQIVEFEGVKLSPYLCSAKVPTIGIGSTYYENGKRVTMDDKSITLERAYELFRYTLDHYIKSVDAMTRDDINQNQFDALVSFAYNVGVNALKDSSLLKKVNANPNDKTITNSFMVWNKARKDGKLVEVKGLTIRRTKEAKLYFS